MSPLEYLGSHHRLHESKRLGVISILRQMGKLFELIPLLIKGYTKFFWIRHFS